MSDLPSESSPPPDGSAEVQEKRIFPETRWGLILEVQNGGLNASKALDELCRLYWKPIFVYAQKRDFSREDAEDLTQGFFEKALRSDLFASARRDSGRLRALLLTAFQRHIQGEWRKESRIKRGSGYEFISLDESEINRLDQRLKWHASVDAETLYDRAWACSILEEVEQNLRKDYADRGRENLFNHLLPLLGWYATSDDVTSRIATVCDITPGAVRAALHRLRTAYRRRLEECVALTVSDPADIQDEMKYILHLGSRLRATTPS